MDELVSVVPDGHFQLRPEEIVLFDRSQLCKQWSHVETWTGLSQHRFFPSECASGCAGCDILLRVAKEVEPPSVVDRKPSDDIEVLHQSLGQASWLTAIVRRSVGQNIIATLSASEGK